MPGDQNSPSQPLRDTQREAFAVACASGLRVEEAYSKTFGAGRGNKPKAYAMREEPDVDARIAYLQQLRADAMLEEGRIVMSQSAYTRDQAMAEAEAARNLGMIVANPNAVVAAVALKAKLAGLTNENERPRKSLKDFSLAELESLAEEMQDMMNGGHLVIRQ